MRNLRRVTLSAHRALLCALLVLLCSATATAALAVGSAGAAPAKGSAKSAASAPRARAASSFLTGIGDEQTEMFGDRNWKQLHTKIARYIAPYDAAVRPYSLDKARAWIKAAEAQHVQVLVAFYHSEYTPTKMPSIATYQHDVQKFVKDFPHVKQYQSWDEANRGNIRGVLASPSASAAAQYYQALLRVCKGCTVLGLDVLDAENISPTLQYIAEFKKEVGKLRTVMPKIWGLHNYSDINRLQSFRTSQLVQALGGTDVADRDRRHRQIRHCVPEPERLRAAPRGEGARLYVQRRSVTREDQAPVHLRLDRGHGEHALRCGADRFPPRSAPGLRDGLQEAARREMQRQGQ